MTTTTSVDTARNYSANIGALLSERGVNIESTAHGSFDVPIKKQAGAHAIVSGQLRVDGPEIDLHLYLRHPTTHAHIPDASVAYHGPASQAPSVEDVAAQLNLDYLTLGPAPKKRVREVDVTPDFRFGF